MKITITCGLKFHSDHLAAALLRGGALERVVTANPRRAYRRYQFPAEHIHFAFPVYVPAWAAEKFAMTRWMAPQLNWWATRAFDRMAARQLGRADVVLAWAWSARHTFTVAKARGLQCVLEECGSANAHQEALLAEEYQRLGIARRRNTPDYVIENEKLECELADAILCPSEYVARSFSIYGIGHEKCLVIPYASNLELFAKPKIRDDNIFRILYVGTVGARKGVIYLLRALAMLPRGRFHCTIIGQIEPGFNGILMDFKGLFDHIPAVPQERLTAYYQHASVFVLPTLDEGMAYVITEALASGTPVITTPNSGAEGTVVDGENGFMVPIRSPEAISAALTSLMEDPERCRAMGEKAAQSAASHTWDAYVVKLLESLSRICDRRLQPA